MVYQISIKESNLESWGEYTYSALAFQISTMDACWVMKKSIS